MHHYSNLLLGFTLFTGAFLLFQVQPLIGKYILPWFGGSPGVWTTCLLFFQAWLLAGYAYAHLAARCLSARGQALVHTLLVGVALLSLPIIPAAAWKPTAAGDPTGRILALLITCVGVPCLALSATGPLLQEWFRRLHPGRSPYRLYALSNAGSLLALVSYPFVVEPALSRVSQATLWSWGLGLYAFGAGACALRLWRQNPGASGAEANPEAEGQSMVRPTPGVRLLWFALPACASVLLLAVTNKMCQDIAVVPFLWVLPLALYLLSFIVCFERPRWYRRGLFAGALLAAVGLLGWALFAGPEFPLLGQIGGYSVGLGVCCMVCHGELFRCKPPAQHLTAYYLTIAAGGAAGGAFVAVIAPLVFNHFLELHWGLMGLALLLVAVHRRERTSFRFGTRELPVWPGALAGAVALSVVLGLQVRSTGRNLLGAQRNFYGVLRVLEYDRETPHGHSRLLQSGGITHGLQFMHPEQAAWPTTYYHERSGVGLAFQALPRGQHRRLGVVGLGVGTLAAYSRTGDVLRVYEINPAVAELARTRFTYLANSAGTTEVVLGDARLALESETAQGFDLLALDAFSGDAIPVHLLTREAFAIYWRHLRPDGVLAVHITNRHLDLFPVVRELARHFGLHLASIDYKLNHEKWWHYSCHWVLLTKQPAWLEQELIRDAALPLGETSQATATLWTDDYTSLFKLLKPL